MTINRNTYIPIRDFGIRGWKYLQTALLISDRVDLWLPDGVELEKAYQRGHCLFKPEDVLELVDSGIIRVGGRLFNFEKNNKQALNQTGDTNFDNTISSWALSGHKNIIIHDNYPGAEIALQELEQYIKDQRSTLAHTKFPHLHAAFKYSNPDTKTPYGQALPDIAVKRANQFFEMNTSDIKADDIRETFKVINSLNAPREQKLKYSIATQLVRLSIEHENIRKSQGCDINLSEPNHATIYNDVGMTKGIDYESTTPPSLDSVIELLEELINLKQIQNTNELMERREKLEKYRNKIWELAYFQAKSSRRTIYDDLNEFFKERKTPLNSFGNSRVGQSLTIFGHIDNISNFVFSAASEVISNGASLAIGLAPSVLSYKDHISQTDSRVWPVIAAFNSERPNNEQIRAVIKDLEWFITKEK